GQQVVEDLLQVAIPETGPYRGWAFGRELGATLLGDRPPGRGAVLDHRVQGDLHRLGHRVLRPCDRPPAVPLARPTGRFAPRVTAAASRTDRGRPTQRANKTATMTAVSRPVAATTISHTQSMRRWSLSSPVERASTRTPAGRPPPRVPALMVTCSSPPNRETEEPPLRRTPTTVAGGKGGLSPPAPMLVTSRSAAL